MKDIQNIKHQNEVRAMFVKHFERLIMLYDMPVAEMMATIFRSKGETDKRGNPIKPETWDDDKSLKRMESFFQEMQDSYLGNKEWSDEFSYNEERELVYKKHLSKQKYAKD